MASGNIAMGKCWIRKKLNSSLSAHLAAKGALLSVYGASLRNTVEKYRNTFEKYSLSALSSAQSGSLRALNGFCCLSMKGVKDPLALRR